MSNGIWAFVFRDHDVGSEIRRSRTWTAYFVHDTALKGQPIPFLKKRTPGLRGTNIKNRLFAKLSDLPIWFLLFEEPSKTPT